MDIDFNEFFDDGFAINVLRQVTPAHFQASMNWLHNVSAAERWNLSEREMSILLNLEICELHSLSEKSSDINASNEYSEIVERLSLLLKLSRFLKMISLSDETTVNDRLFLAPHFFKGRSIKQLLLENNSIYNFYHVVSHLSLLADAITEAQSRSDEGYLSDAMRCELNKSAV